MPIYDDGAKLAARKSSLESCCDALAHDAALASSGGRLHPVCGLWRVEATDKMSTYCATGQRSLRGFAEHIGFIEVTWPTQPIDSFFNINTMDDLRRAELMLAD